MEVEIYSFLKHITNTYIVKNYLNMTFKREDAKVYRFGRKAKYKNRDKKYKRK